MEKDYSLLRPFDLEAAKRGEKLCWRDGGVDIKLISGPDSSGCLCIEYSDGSYHINYLSVVRMAPLAWVEGRPVYRGDVLYKKIDGAKVEVLSTYESSYCAKDSCLNGYLENITWQKPKTKREGWINAYHSNIYKTPEDANSVAMHNRLALVKVEWEE